MAPVSDTMARDALSRCPSQSGLSGVVQAASADRRNGSDEGKIPYTAIALSFFSRWTKFVIISLAEARM